MRQLSAFLLSFSFCLGSSAPAMAEWEHLNGPLGSITLAGISAPDSQNVFTLGFAVVPSQMLFYLEPHVYASRDGGQTFSEVTNNLDGGGFSIPRAICFVDATHGWLGIGSKLFRTNSGGEVWASVEVDIEIGALHFFDRQNGVMSGTEGEIRLTDNGGVSWTTVESPVTVSLKNMFWLDRRRGFISGYSEREETDQETNESVTYFGEGIVLATTDGGQSWSASAPIAERALGEVFFLDDGLTGWVAGMERIDEQRTEARLYVSSDGGASFVEVTVPLDVGTISGQDTQVRTSDFRAMYWEDEQHGHLGGSAFVAKLQQFGGSGTDEIYIFRTVDYWTHDGGATWVKSDLGFIDLDLSNIGQTQNDGILLAGTMRNLYQGWMVGHERHVWGYQEPCTASTDCLEPYSCEEGSCGISSCDPPCAEGETCEEGACVTSNGDDPQDPSNDETSDGDGDAKDIDEAGGCHGTHQQTATLLLAPVLIALCLRSRRRGWHRDET